MDRAKKKSMKAGIDHPAETQAGRIGLLEDVTPHGRRPKRIGTKWIERHPFDSKRHEVKVYESIQETYARARRETDHPPLSRSA